MTTKITGYQAPTAQLGTDKSVTRARDAATGAGSGGTATSSSSGSPVTITGSARQLSSLEQSIQAMPVVDEARVSSIRSAIENGTYEVSPERIADKLMRTEQDLQGLE